MTLRGGVGDILPAVLPADFVAAVLHKPDEVFTAAGLCHAFINCDFQIHLPALPLVVGAVLPGRHGVFLLLLRLGLHHRQAVRQAQPVRSLTQGIQTIHVAVVLLAGIAAYRVDDEVRVDVIPVRVGCGNNLEAGDLLRQLQGNLVRHLRGDRIVGMEGLHHVIVHPPLGAVVQALGVHKLLEGSRRNAVDAGNQRPALVIYLGFLTAVVEDTVEAADRLRPFAFYKVDDSHSITALSLEGRTAKNSRTRRLP